MTETKEARNARVQARWDELMQEGKHGHYETLFRVVREEVERERGAAWDAVCSLIRSGSLNEPAHSERNGIVLAANHLRARMEDFAPPPVQ